MQLELLPEEVQLLHDLYYSMLLNAAADDDVYIGIVEKLQQFVRFEHRRPLESV